MTTELHRFRPCEDVNLTGPGRTVTWCLIRSSQFPDSGRSAKLGIFELDSSEPDVGDLTHPANCGHSDGYKSLDPNGWKQIRQQTLSLSHIQASKTKRRFVLRTKGVRLDILTRPFMP